MADAKVSELVTATSLGSSDLLYLVQSNTSKKIAAATVFANAANAVLSGRVTLGDTPQLLGAPGIVNINTAITELTADASGGTLNIPTGAQGQIKFLVMTTTAGGSYNMNTANISANANIVFSLAGHSAQLLFTNNKWFVVGGTANVTY